VRNYGNGCYPVCLFEEWLDNSRHIEDLERPGKNCQRFGMD